MTATTTTATNTTPTVGVELTVLRHDHNAHLNASAISDVIKAERGYRTITSHHEWEQVGGQPLPKKSRRMVSGIAFPIYRLGKPDPYTWVLRPDRPRTDGRSDPPRFIKYEFPKGVTNTLDVLPRFSEALMNPNIPLWITEGAKKADALASLGVDIVPANLNGVWGWRCQNNYGGKMALPELDNIPWQSRLVVLAFDSDVARKMQVGKAFERLAHNLAARGAKVVALLLPQASDDDKLGVDDAIAKGMSWEQLQAHIVPLSDVVGLGREKLAFKHPETGGELHLPAGYVLTSDRIVRVHNKTMIAVYSGITLPVETGSDLASGAETMTVRFSTRGGKMAEVIAPRAELARAKGVIEFLGARGANVHDANAKEVSRFLIEFAHENRDALPHRTQVERLGLVNGGLVTPATAIGFADSVRYSGIGQINTASDVSSYRSAICEAVQWVEAYPLWLAVAFSVASPFIRRIRPRRNPTCYFAGESNSGKTTIAHFGIGAWGVPYMAPFQIMPARTTKAGFSQNFDHVNGLPVLIDEAHTANDPKMLESVVYDFANGQGYSKGGADGRVRGGQEVGGTLLLAGEAMPEFRHAGSRNRVLWVDVSKYPAFGPGAERGSDEGKRRSELLKEAYKQGSGALGPAVARLVWDEWAEFVSVVDKLSTAKELQESHVRDWQHGIAIGAAALFFTFKALDIPTPDWFKLLMPRWVEMLAAGRTQVDPAREAWEDIAAMLSQGQHEIRDGWIIVELQHEIVAFRQQSENYWRVLTKSRQFKERVGSNAPQLHGRAWVRSGLALVGKNDESTIYKSGPHGISGRCVMVPIDKLLSAGE